MGLMLEVKTGWDGIRDQYLHSLHGRQVPTDNLDSGRLGSTISA
jgi:flagellar protein FliS